MPDTASAWVVETSPQTFQQDVVERSREVPVVVDFWAPWCHPCRLLGPILEKLAAEFAGRFVLVKADTDQMPDMAAGFGVHGIPAVFGLRDGKIVEAFAGVLPEPEVRAWLERLLPSPGELLVAEAQRLEESDPAEAEAKYRQAIELLPREAAPQIGLARVLLKRGRIDESRAIIDELAARGFLEPEAEELRAELDLKSKALQAGSVEECRRALAEAPGDLRRKLDLAAALAAEGCYDESLQLGLDVVQQDRGELREEAKGLMVDVFHTLGRDNELVTDYQRRLSLALY